MLKAGFARLDITPPLGTQLAGYFYERLADGILDPLELNAVAVSDGSATVLLIAADLIGMTLDPATEIRELIATETGVSADHIMISCLHQHTSVRIGHAAYGIKKGPYFEVVCRKFVDVARLAIADLREVALCTAQVPTSEPISFIRRYRMKDGSVATNPGRGNPNIAHPIGNADNTVRLVRFKREDARDIALVNFSTHPDVITGTRFSADWPGFVRRYVEQDLPGVHCCLFNGAQGDTNHINVEAPAIKDRYAFSAHMGRVIADGVLSLWGHEIPRAADRVCGAVELICNKTRTDGEERYEEMKAFYDAYQAGTLGYKPHITELGEAKRIIAIRSARMYSHLPVTVISVGEVSFVGFGGEPFTAYADSVRRAFPDRFVIACCCTNASEGYLPTADAFADGGYEAKGTPFSTNLQEQMVGKAVELLSRQ